MKTVLITGCSSGIGRMTAQRFAARGWNVVATARTPADLADLVGDTVIALPLDVTDEATIAAAVAAAIDRFGAIDVLVNNAGYGVFGPLEGVTAEQLERQFKVNFFGMANVIRHVLPFMRQRKSGTIVNLSSIGGRIASPYVSAYYATKFAVEGMSESLRYELKPHGIRVKVIEPTHFKTAFIERALQQWSGHAAYEPQLSNVKAWVAHGDAHAPDAGPVAEMIYKAATDSSDRLRYPVHGRLMRTVHALLPDAVWRALLGGGMHRAPKPSRTAASAAQNVAQPF